MKVYAKDPFEAKYQLLIKKSENTDHKHSNNFKFLLNTRMIWIIFIKKLKNIIQIKKASYRLFLVT